MDIHDIERIAAYNCDMPKDLLDIEKCLFRFLRCLYREYDAGTLSHYYGNIEKEDFLKYYNKAKELRKMYLKYIGRWNKCEMMLSEVEKSTCNQCQTCETCRKIARIWDGRER